MIVLELEEITYVLTVQAVSLVVLLPHVQCGVRGDRPLPKKGVLSALHLHHSLHRLIFTPSPSRLSHPSLAFSQGAYVLACMRKMEEGYRVHSSNLTSPLSDTTRQLSPFRSGCVFHAPNLHSLFSKCLGCHRVYGQGVQRCDIDAFQQALSRSLTIQHDSLYGCTLLYGSGTFMTVGVDINISGEPMDTFSSETRKWRAVTTIV